MKELLLFVYNANSGLFSTVSDFAHKIISPSTYQCQLCALTYGNFSVKQEWKSFIEGLAIKSGFLHQDEFVTQYDIHAPLPAVFLVSNKNIREVITQQQIENCRTLQELKSLVNNALKKHVQHYHSNI
jgi:hypothetical protein